MVYCSGIQLFSVMTISYVFLVLLTASLSLLSAKGEIHIIGDSDGWTDYHNYTDWAQGKIFHVGDTLVFNYVEGTHNVMQVNGSAYEGCVKDPNLGVLATGNDTISLMEVGRIWYICGVGDHCEYGQKLSITVVP